MLFFYVSNDFLCDNCGKKLRYVQDSGSGMHLPGAESDPEFCGVSADRTKNQLILNFILQNRSLQQHAREVELH